MLGALSLLSLLASANPVSGAAPITSSDVQLRAAHDGTIATMAGPLACFESAVDETSLDADASRVLCEGSSHDQPVACYISAKDRTSLSDDASVELCICARSTSPVDCFLRALEGTELDDQEAVELCNARTLERVERPHCK